MRHKKSNETISPSPSMYKVGPQALEREVSTVNQTRWDEGTIRYGDDDAFPIRIIDAVNKSPTTTSCIGTIETFLKGSGFSDPDLMNLVIDKDGTTLYQLHCQICQYMALLKGFCVNFKFNSMGKITYSYLVGLETVRFKRPADGENNPVIDSVKVNPYFGTAEYQKKFTNEFPLWNPLAVGDQIKEFGTKFPGQIYYFGNTRPPFKFYPVPKYWSGEQWIYVDGQIQQFHKKNLDNGFFQSVMMTVIGDPNQMSKNPKLQGTRTKSDGVTKENYPTHTVGEEFREDMAKNFSGVDKAGNVMTLWAKNESEAPKIQSFPVNSQFDVLAGTFTDAIRGITIATEVPAILANLPQQNSSLGSDGNAMNMAIQLMQSRVSGDKRTLENFYNTILLPNLADESVKGKKVEILDYNPISSSLDYYNEKVFVECYWPFMDGQEKAEFINQNISEIQVKPRPATIPVPEPAPGITPPATTPIPQTAGPLKGLSMREINKLMSIANKFNKRLLTQEQARLALTDYGMDEERIQAFLFPKEEENEITYPFSVSK